ncbi:NAD-dependent epimerase/dehydratase family protein [Phytopseudomonas dryadis]|nr:NAD-dependent epimerase/dehydratase family protein [Pseudomonas dryadis]
MKVLLTGASGFVGRAMQVCLRDAGHECVAVTRQSTILPNGRETLALGNISAQTDWQEVLDGVECVVHLAGQAHVAGKAALNVQATFNAVNVEATINLVEQAINQRVKRFVYVSSIGVHGATSNDTFITEASPFIPYSPYTHSKYDAEKALQRLAAHSQMEWVIVRPPLIYAADAPGNFRQLLGIVEKGYPLPFAGLSNRRSMVALENVVDFLMCCCTHDKASNQAFVISDGQELSTTEIVTTLASGMGKRQCLFWIPDLLIKMGAALLGRQHTYTQLFGSLQVDSGKARLLLGWRPVISTHDGLVKAGREFLGK